MPAIPNAYIFDGKKTTQRKKCGPVPGKVRTFSGKVRTFFNKILALTYIRAAGTLALIFSPP
jgi:hypothetical protein